MDTGEEAQRRPSALPSAPNQGTDPPPPTPASGVPTTDPAPPPLAPPVSGQDAPPVESPAPPFSPTESTSGDASTRSSGRTVKPSWRATGQVPAPLTNESLASAAGAASGSGPSSHLRRASTSGAAAASPSIAVRSLRNRQRSNASSANTGARRLKLSLKSSAPGRTSRAGQPKTHAYMQGFEDREMDSSDDETGEGMAFEEQLILRLPEGDVADRLKERIRKREVGTEDSEEISMKFKDSRRAMFKVGQDMFSARLVDLPSIIESHKTLDNRKMFKVGDISQMLLATHIIRDESEVTAEVQPTEKREDGLSGPAGQHDGFNVDDFIYPHGITPPMRWARKRRFRKRAKKKQTTETVEQEVQRLLAEDSKATSTSFELVDAAEIDMEENGGGAGGRGRDAADGASTAGTPYPDMDDGETDMASQMDEGDDRGDLDSQMGEGSTFGGDDDVDLDLQAELEAALGEDDDEEDVRSETGSVASHIRNGRSQSRAVSEDEDLWDDAAVAGDGDGDADADGDAGNANGSGDEEEDEEEEEDLDEEVREEKAREDQLEAECREIDSLLRRKQAEADQTLNALIKKRQLDALKRLTHERDVKRSRLAAVKEERKERKEREQLQANREKEARQGDQVEAHRREQERERDNLAAAAAEAEAEDENEQQQQQRAGGAKGKGSGSNRTSSAAEAPRGSALLTHAAGVAAISSASSEKPSSQDMDVDEEAQTPAQSHNTGNDEDAEGDEEEDAEGEDDEDAEGEEDDLWA
ncbi:hypothetical protein BCV69DRAFT_282806 [Microstroma glucosiphilum]|uniref:TAFII55 protein conserved region domain-containing protein n=1 Tax=Pseudomicrostroma glucosiphilum TaxID=1684307 RepID=A0A316U5T1_9BASI|nr:hypothetical protein BCV69DRAFT_282806 [Pseudomicrostroma glucosiphilum]PWN20596.1 hypothetical protein BCV69DRAFT_282806 [Pseudomicrostroma glucosiphilum]